MVPRGSDISGRTTVAGEVPRGLGWSGRRTALEGVRAMARVIHFEIPVDDPDRAQAFYHDAFGWEIAGWGGPVDYRLATTGPESEAGINGALALRSEMSAWIHVGVDSVDEALGRIEAAGGTVVTPKAAIPGVGHMAYCRDPEGNTIGVYEDDPSAA